jgi:hypothetical protein
MDRRNKCAAGDGDFRLWLRLVQDARARS